MLYSGILKIWVRRLNDILCERIMQNIKINIFLNSNLKLKLFLRVVSFRNFYKNHDIYIF